MSDIQTFYGGSILAMIGKNCISIIADNRLGNGPITISKKFSRIFQITPKSFIGLPSFIPDCQNLLNKIRKHVSLFKLSEGREIEPQELANLISAILYSHREQPLMTSPIVVGLDSSNNPYVCGMDCLGCKTEPKSFVATGTASSNLMGMCEILYKEDLNCDDLFIVAVQTFLNSIDRDALSGWGAHCIIANPEQNIVKHLKGRCD